MRRRPNSRLMRNKLDLSDRVQVRMLRKRLCLSHSELARIVDKVGNSISCISKEVGRNSHHPDVATSPTAAIELMADR